MKPVFNEVRASRADGKPGCSYDSRNRQSGINYSAEERRRSAAPTRFQTSGNAPTRFQTSGR